MIYAGSDYRLRPISPEDYSVAAGSYKIIKSTRDFRATLAVLLNDEQPEMPDLVMASSENIQDAYGDGGGFYGMALGIGVAALRRGNTVTEVPAVEPEDWDGVIVREQGLLSGPNVRTIETLSGIGLLEVLEVNSGYIDGYQQTFDTPGLTPFTGFTGLGTLHAHDLMHQASLRGDDHKA